LNFIFRINIESLVYWAQFSFYSIKENFRLNYLKTYPKALNLGLKGLLLPISIDKGCIGLGDSIPELSFFFLVSSSFLSFPLLLFRIDEFLPSGFKRR